MKNEVKIEKSEVPIEKEISTGQGYEPGRFLNPIVTFSILGSLQRKHIIK